MKIITIRNLTYLLILVFVISCSDPNNTDEEPPTLPSVATLDADLTGFQTQPKLSAKQAANNFTTAVTIGATFKVIYEANVALAKSILDGAHEVTPVYMGEGTWKWNYTISGDQGNIGIELLAMTNRTDVDWEFYVSADNGSISWNLALLMSGTSTYNGEHGLWNIHNPTNEQIISRTEWLIEDDSTQIMLSFYENGDNDASEPFARIVYTYSGSTKTLLFYNFNEVTETVVIWDVETGAGSIRSNHYQNGEQYCWDDSFQDVPCE